MNEIRSLILRITEHCNLRCRYCYAAPFDTGCTAALTGSASNTAAHSSPADMTAELALSAVSLCCPEGGSLSIQFTGGEPLLNFPVIEAVYAFGQKTNRKLSLSIQTNGPLLTPDICRRLAAMNCAVGVSLDGIADANRLRLFSNGQAAFPAVIQGIRNLGDAGLRCNLTTVITKINVRHLGQLPDLALYLGNVSGIGLDLFRPLGRGKAENLSPTEADLTDGLKTLIARTKEIRSAGISFRLRELERLKKRLACIGCDAIYCYAQTDQSLAVDAAGDCWPCSSLAGDDSYCLGNLKDGLPAPPRSSLHLEAPPDCAACAAFSYCKGGCPAGRSAIGGGPDPLTCTMYHILFNELNEV